MKKYYITLMILMISLISNAIECDGLKKTADKYWETDNLINAIQNEYGTAYTIGDWLNLKELPDIDEWIACMELEDDDQFILTRDGEYIYSGSRQYFVQYFADGNVPGTWLVHDQIGNKLFLGSWFDIEMSILAINTEPPFMLTSPNGGEYWKWDTQHLINWTTNDSVIENVNIWLSHDSGNSYPDLLFENTANDGEEPWTIAEAQCNTSRIKIEGYDSEGVLVAEDESDGDFFIYTTPPIDLDSGLVAWYPFNGNANDESGNGNDGIVHGAILTNDRFGNENMAYHMDGISNYINASNSNTLNIDNNEMTISFWMLNYNDPDDMHFIGVSKGGWDLNTGYELLLRGSWYGDEGTVEFNIASNTEPKGIICQNSFQYSGQWVYLVGVFKNGNAGVYINSGFSLTGDIGTANVITTDHDLYIGTRDPGNAWCGFLRGIIDDIRIYNRALNEFEIQALYHEEDWMIKPSFITELNDLIACKNDSVAFVVHVEGVEPIQYQWQKDGIDIPGATDSALIIPYIQGEDDGEYRCVCTNDYGTSTSNIATLDVEFALPTIISGFTSVHEYQVTTYSADLQEGHTYEFIVEGGNVIDGTENSVTVHWGTPGQGFISLIEMSDLGCYADTNVLNVTVGYLGIKDHETNKLSVYPNPFSTSTTLDFELTQPGKVEIKIFNQMGEVIEMVQMNCRQGKNEFTWKTESHPSGIYFIRLLMNENVQIIKALKH